MSRIHIPAMVCLLAWATVMPAPTAAQRAVRIGTLEDGPWERGDEVLGLFQREITDLLAGEFNVTFPESARIVGDWDAEQVTAGLDRLFSSAQVDIVITLGVLGSLEAVRRSSLPKPVIAPLVVDPELEGLPYANGASGVRNLNYVAHPETFQRDLAALLEVVPVQRLAVMFNQVDAPEMSGLANRMMAAADALGVVLLPVPVSRTVEPGLPSIPAEAQAVYVTPLPQLEPGEFDELVQGLIQRRLPSFSYFGRPEVERGLMIGLRTDEHLPRIARRVALNIRRILEGERAGDLPVAISFAERLTINMATARAIGVSPSFGAMAEADLLFEEDPNVERVLSLRGVVVEAVESNLDLLSAQHRVDAGSGEVGVARSNLLPQIELSALGVGVDKEQAEASFGQQPERSITGQAIIRQIIYSEPAWANLAIQGQLQRTRVADQQELRLDIIDSAAETYLNVLRARTAERIVGEDVRLTRSHLELARIRQEVGQSGPGEVYRWESRLAESRRGALAASAARRAAETALNRLLHRPQAEEFRTEEPGLDDPDLVVGDPRFMQFISGPQRYALLSDFLVLEAFQNSPELRGLDALVAAGQRSLGAANRAFWVPTIALEASFSDRMYKDGLGAEPPPGSPIAPPPEQQLSVGIQASLPLFTGTGRIAEHGRASNELRGLRVQREAVQERIEQRVRTALHAMSASYPSIDLARQAEEAARRTLDLVTEAYSAGTASVVDLLDAQNAAVAAELGAATAVYDFLIDFMASERAVGRSSFFSTREEQDDLFERLTAFVQSRESAPPRP